MHCKGLFKSYKPSMKSNGAFIEYDNNLFNDFYIKGHGIHFVQSNTRGVHVAWDFFKKTRTKKLFL